MGVKAAFVYVFPARNDDILKLGMSRDPFERLRSFHPRYYEFFDIDQGWIVQADDERNAFRIENELGKFLAIHNAMSPLQVDRRAGGHTEWYRGAMTPLRERAEAIVRAGGHPPIDKLGEWVPRRLITDASLMFEWSNTMLDGIDAYADTPQGSMLETTLRNALDAYAFFQIDIRPYTTMDVFNWYRMDRERRPIV